MSKTAIPYAAPDITSIARSLKAQLAEKSPSHLELLNMLARATGHRNFQHLRAECVAKARFEGPPAPPAPVVDMQRIERTARCFDEAGRLTRWPPKESQRVLALWVLWAALPARQAFSEKEISAALTALHGFGDHALLRRELVDRGLVARTRDGRIYRRVEQTVPPDALVMIRRVSARESRLTSG